jgi:hypothetical protein
VQQLGGCCSKDAVDTDGYGPYRGGRVTAAGMAFELFVMEILRRDPETELVSTSLLDRAPYETADYGTDFVALRRGKTLLVEAKAATPQTSRRLAEQSRQLQGAGRVYMEQHPGEQEPELVLAFPGVLPQSKRAAAAQQSLEIWDGPYLRSEAERLDITVPPGIAFGDEAGLVPGYDLASRLTGIRPGVTDWPAYEKYCEDLLSFLFVPPLNPPIPQSRDERHVNRRDYILPNYAVDGSFWHFMRTHYEAHLVVAEVKNLRRGPGKDEILQVANYLNPRGTGLFALILARADLDQTARWICREQWVQYSKLIVGLSDEDVVQMVRTRMSGGDPAELVRQKVEDFRLGI